MKLKFSEMEEKHLPNFNGGEGVFYANMYVDEKMKILRGKLVPGASIGLHRHVPTSEVIFILEGVGTAFCNGKQEDLQAGDCHYCPKGSEHTLQNTGEKDLLFYAVVPQQ